MREGAALMCRSNDSHSVSILNLQKEKTLWILCGLPVEKVFGAILLSSAIQRGVSVWLFADGDDEESQSPTTPTYSPRRD